MANKITVAKKIVEQILERLETGELKPGEQLPPQRVMAHQFGVGRSSIREAINTLSVLGYLDVTQGKGSFIRSDLPADRPAPASNESFLEAGTIFDLMEAREILECHGATLAAQQADSSAISKVHEAVKDIRKHQNSISHFFDADWRFHVALAEASGNKVICEMIRMITEKVHRYNIQFRATASRKNREFALKTAEQILSHLMKGDGSKTAKSMRNHLSTINNELREIILELAPMMAGIKK